MKQMKQVKSKSYISYIFYIILIVNFVGMIVWRLLDQNMDISSFLLVDGLESFHDFYEAIIQCKDMTPYQQNAVWGPICYLYFGFFRLFVSEDVMINNTSNVSGDQVAMLLLWVHIAVCVIFMGVCIYHLVHGREWRKITAMFVVVFSGPGLFAMFAGNWFPLVISLIMLFYILNRYEQPWIKEASLLCIAIASGIWIYSIFFVLILAKDRKYKDIIKVLFETILIYIMAFLLLGGIGEIQNWWGNFANWRTYTSQVGFRYQVCLSSFVRFITFAFGKTVQNSWYILLRLVLVVLAVVSICKTDEKWKAWALTAGIAILFPQVSFQYTILFMVPAVVFFLNSEPENKVLNYIYMLCFAGMMLIVPGRIHSGNFVNITEVLRPTIEALTGESFVMILMILLIGECMIKKRNRKIEG